MLCSPRSLGFYFDTQQLERTTEREGDLGNGIFKSTFDTGLQQWKYHSVVKPLSKKETRGRTVVRENEEWERSAVDDRAPNNKMYVKQCCRFNYAQSDADVHDVISQAS